MSPKQNLSTPGKRAELLNHRHIWQASRLQQQPDMHQIATRHTQLDQLLGGWPADGLTELLSDHLGIGELRLLMPAVAELSQQQTRWVAWIAPPQQPFPQALIAAGVDISRVLVLRPQNQRDLLWAYEQCLKTGTCSAALCWPQLRLRGRDVQRFRIAARQGRTCGFLFRRSADADLPSAADLRIVLRPAMDNLANPLADAHPDRADDRLEMRVLKRRGGWGTDFFRLQLDGDPRAHSYAHLQAQLERWRAANSEELVKSLPPSRSRLLPQRQENAFQPSVH